ncbi:MAG: hypothetical protein WEA10_05940 [Actinomycetota bacterium]
MNTARRVGSTWTGVTAIAVVLVLVAAVILAVLPAGAHHTDFVDGNDVEGRFDVRSVEHAHEARPRKWLVTMVNKWTIRNTWDTGYVVLNLDTLNGPQMDYYAVIRSDGRRLHAQVHRDRARGKDPIVAKPRAWKTGRSVGFEIPWSRLKVAEWRVDYRWSVQTLWVGGPCPATCFDFAPNGGAMIPQPYPTPTDTVTRQTPQPDAQTTSPSPTEETPSPESTSSTSASPVTTPSEGATDMPSGLPSP